MSIRQILKSNLNNRFRTESKEYAYPIKIVRKIYKKGIQIDCQNINGLLIDINNVHFNRITLHKKASQFQQHDKKKKNNVIQLLASLSNVNHSDQRVIRKRFQKTKA